MKPSNGIVDISTPGKELQGKKKYWLDKLSGELVIGHFPYDYEGKGSDEHYTDTVTYSFRDKIVTRLIQLKNESDHRLHMIMVAIIDLLIHRYTGNSDIIVGTTIHKQEQEGDYVNTILPLRNQVEDDMTFKQFLLQVKDTVSGAVENQNYPVEQLIGQLMVNTGEKISTLFETAVLLENIHDKKYLRSIKPAILFSFHRVDEEMKLAVEYRPSLYKKNTIKRIITHFNRLLEVVIFDVDIKLASIDILSAKERQELIVEFNNTVNDYPDKKMVHELCEDQAVKTPNNTALEFDDKKLSYGELNHKKNRLAGLLGLKGVTKGSIVGIMASRSLEVIVTILGVLKAGGAYLPLDTQYPENRKKYILEDSGTTLLLTDRTPREYLNRKGEIIDITGWALGVEEGNVNGLENIYVPPAEPVEPTDVAYIIYTSGSTGKPKGVMIEHRGLVNYVWWAAGSYVKNRNTVSADFPLYTSISFDLTVTSIFTPLVTGGKIIIYGDEIDVPIEKILKENKVGIVKLTPTHLKLIGKNEGGQSRIDCFIVGGEELETRLANEIHNRFAGKVEIYNEYGPTEATVGCMIYRFNPAVDKSISVPIGVPSANARIYILDKNLEPVPGGVTGEIYISGEGVARGYLNRPELTAERFTINPFEPGQRLYGTGDLGHFMTDGNIRFKGRKDNQVKIRGHRIELGEIENKLTRHSEIKDALITVKENENGDKYLCAYVVLNRELDLAQIREYVSGELPDYMIPSHFVNIEKIPLNPHGKVDRGALPDPMGIGMKENIPYIPPRNMIEKLLTEVWEKVLGRGNIGVNENFFMLGGDSIKSIQIISRINSAGYKLQMRDLFQYPVISDLALKVKQAEHIPDQAPVMGVVPLAPIQEWFFDKHRIDIHQFNQAMMFYSRDGFDERAINSVFTRIQEHHEALRMTYKEENGKIIQINHGLDYPLSLQVFDLRNREENSIESLEARANEIQAGIHLETGPLMKLGLFHLDDGDRLLVVIHHLVIDGISWRILFEDIETLYQQYKKGEPLTLPLKTDSFKVWAEKLSDYANSETFLKEKAYWADLESINITPQEKDFDEPDNYRKDATTLSFILSEQETGDLLTKVNDAFGTAIDDILLTALGMGIKKSWGHNPVLVSLEGHGREEILEGIDISRTLGWFTSTYPLVMDISYEDDLGRQIKELKEAIRKVPNKGIGYGILKYITGEEYKKDIRFQLNPQFVFNYLGQFDAEIGQMSFEIAGESSGNAMSREGEREFDFDISGMIANKRLEITVTYNKKHYKPETMNVLVNHIREELKYIIAFCSSKKNTELTPSDFTYKGLSIENIDRLTASYPNLEDLYTLTPLQEGMLFHSLVDERSYTYFEQTSYRLHGELDISLVEKSLNELFKRHDILRTVFVYQDIERTVQVVLKEGAVDFYYEDISKIGEREEKEKFIKEFKVKDKERGFDLTKGSLMRVSILHMDKSEYEFNWSFHHILMDGWCIGILNAEFFEIYTGYLENRPYRLPAVKPYRAYIQWLEKQDKDASVRYWQNYLDSFTGPTGVPRSRILKKDEDRYKNERLSIVLDRTKTAGLNRLAAGSHVTLNTVARALWGILLRKYNRKNDVLFGTVVSGRPFELEGVESMVGLFINTIPVRIRFDEKMKFNRLVQQIQEDAIASEPHHYNSLAEIQAGHTLKQDLIDHLFVFENYPIAEQIEGYGSESHTDNRLLLKILDVDVFEQSNYDFNVILSGSEQLTITFGYNGNVYDRDLLDRVGAHFREIVDRVLENEEIKIEEIGVLAEEEKNKILKDFKNTYVEYPKDRIFQQKFAGQNASTPGKEVEAGEEEFEEYSIDFGFN